MRLNMNLLEGFRSAAPPSQRRTVNDGVRNRAEFYSMTHFKPLWDVVQRFRPAERVVNRSLINSAILKMPPRPEPLSTKAPYTSWDSLTDRTFAGRHLRPTPAENVPDLADVAELFRRGEETRLCPKSTVLFACFAQWFTDGFLRSDRTEPRNPRKTTSSHEIDLCQLYGLNPTVTGLLRAGHDGLLKTDPETTGEEEFPPRLCTPDGKKKGEYDGLDVLRFEISDPKYRDSLFAMGGDRSNSQLGYAMMNVLFFREHNRIARALADEYPEWQDDRDERLFQTARNILTVLLIKVVICEYINHISPFHFKFSLNGASFSKASWFRQNWMAIEFNLLYRWHSLVPSTIQAGDDKIPIQQTLFNNELLLNRGLGQLFEDFSNQPAGRIGLFNTPPNLVPFSIEELSIQHGRDVGLASYNDYRANCGFPRVTDFDQISSDPRVQEALREKYKDVANIEFYVGLFAEDCKPDSALPALIGRMVAVDAFSQAFTNPLLAPRVFKKETFSPLGMRIIEETNSLSDILNRNVEDRGRPYFVSMTRKDWERGK